MKSLKVLSRPYFPQVGIWGRGKSGEETNQNSFHNVAPALRRGGVWGHDLACFLEHGVIPSSYWVTSQTPPQRVGRKVMGDGWHILR